MSIGPLFKISFFLQFWMLISIYSSGQRMIKKVSSKDPSISISIRAKYLYAGADNPVEIITGVYKTIRISVSSGTLKKSSHGMYLIRPDKKDTIETIVVSTPNGSSEFVVEIRSIPPPIIDIMNGFKNEDGMFTSFYKTSGIGAYVRDVPFDVKMTVDSFTITLSDSALSLFHVNIGSKWDTETTKILNKSKAGCVISISNVYVSGPGEKYFIKEEDLYLIK